MLQVEVGDLMSSIDFHGTLNMNRTVKRAGDDHELVPVISPGSQLFSFHPDQRRPYTGLDKMVFQSFPVEKMNFSQMSEAVTRRQNKDII